jgi:hypothetical protein
MRTIRLTIDLTYDDELIHGDEGISIKWFENILLGDNLHLFELGDIGDILGSVKVIAGVEKENE